MSNVWFLSIDRKQPTTLQQVVESISSQKLTRKCNNVHVITSCRDKNTPRTNLQENRSIFNQIRHIQEIGETLISLPTKPSTPYHIGYVVNIPLRFDWYYSIFFNDEKMEKSTTSSAPFLLSSLSSDTKIIRPMIYFRVKITDIENQYDIYDRTCEDGSSIIEGVGFTVSYAPVSGIRSLCIIIAIASEKRQIIFVLDISNDFQNIILPYPK